MACSPQQRNNVYAEKHDTQWCICQYCVKDVQIVEKVCCKKPSILSIETFNEFDCITQSEAFANISWNKDVLEAAIGAWRDLSVTHTDLLNINYRFIAYKKYVSQSYGYSGKKKCKPLSNCVIKKMVQYFQKDIFKCLTVMYDFIMLYEIR